jgi:DNA-directed RNA polymerase subunit RPC12/RpoP
MIRKSEADKVPLSPSDGMRGSIIACAKAFYCSKGYDMLNVDLSMNGEVVARYFADPVTKEYKGFLIGEKWGKIKIDTIALKLEGEEKQSWNFARWYYPPKWRWENDKNAERIVLKILGSSIDLWESRNDSEKYYKRQKTKYERLQEKINNLLMPTPAGFEEWADGCLDTSVVVKIDDKLDALGLYKYQCTECSGVWGRKQKYRSKRIITCPHCGKELRVKNNGSAESENFYLFQICADNPNLWYERYMFGIKQWDRKDGWEFKLYDSVLGVIASEEQYGDCYYHESEGFSETRHNGLLATFGKGYIYPDFGGAEDLMTDQQARCLKALAYKKAKINANKVIIHDTDNGLEYLIKGGYDRLAADVIEKDALYYLNRHADNFQDYIGLDKQRCLRLKQINGSIRERDWLKYEKKTGRKVSAVDLQFFLQYGIDPNDTFNGTRMMLSYIPSPSAFRNYLEKQAAISTMTFRQTISEYSDYIRMAKEQGLNLSSEIFFKPKNLKAAHDECVKVAHEKEYENRAKEIVKKFPKVPEILKDIQSKYTFESGEFAIIVPEKIEDIIAEGRALGHCIDTSDRYFDRIQNHVTYLVFLRHSSARNVSWYTLEIEPGGTVRQQRTTGNRQNKADTEAYMPFIREWQKVVRQRISDEDKAAAVRSREIRLAEYKELREKKETVRNGLLAGQLLVDVLEADLVEAM